jgi:serine/threonine protein kinase
VGVHGDGTLTGGDVAKKESDPTIADPIAADGASVTAPTASTEGLGIARPTEDGRATGSTIGRYEIVSQLGAGGMGIVYLAYDPKLDRPVAVKVLRPGLRTAQARLLREGQSVARLAHPNVVRVFDVGTEGDELFVAMEYVEGTTLRRWLSAAARRPRAILEVFNAAGRGLAAAHAVSVVHRDFKPDNVLVGRDGRVVVTDFGLARVEADDADADADEAVRAGVARPLRTTLTRTGSRLGTPAYMSPEQLRGEVADARSDQFSFCVALWEAIFGTRPFAIRPRASLDEVRRAVEAGVVDPEVPTTTAALERALRRGLALAAADRFADMNALLAALEPERATAQALAPGDRISHFRIVDQIGRGGMGIVYRARDEKLGRDVALKVLPGDVVSRPERRERFLREARAAAAVVHPAIAAVYEVGTDGEIPFIAMEYVAGRTLRDVLGAGAMAVADAIRIGVPVADAIARAHRAGVVHRDLKPENVMVDGDRQPKILDFGIARVLDASGQHATDPDRPPAAATPDGSIVGTPAYMSPEQARGHTVDGRSDVFSFGTMMFEMVCGVAPFAGGSAVDVVTAIIRDLPRTPRSIVPSVPAELERIVLKCLEKEPDDRYQSAADLAVDLRRLLRETETGTLRAPPVLETPPRRRRTGRLVAAGAGVIAATAGVIAWRASSRDRAASSPGAASAAPDAAPRWIDHPLAAASTQGHAAAAISPDGKTLALARDGRLVLQDVASGRVTDLPPPAAQPNWIAWFPDGKQLLLGVPSATAKIDLIAQPVGGGAGHTLAPHVWGAALDRRGERIATFDETGIRVSALDGSQARLLVGTREEAEFAFPVWSPDERWIAYGIRGPDLHPQIRAVAVDGSTDVTVIDDAALTPPSGLPSYLWLPDGRLVYETFSAAGTTMMAVAIDPATAKARGPARELARFPDQAGLEEATADGRAILYSRMQPVRTRYRGDVTRAPLVLELDAHQAWDELGRSRDGSTTFYAADGGPDHTDILAVDSTDRPRVIASLAGALDPQLSPDGDAIDYLEVDANAHTITLRAAPIAGGAPVLIEKLPYSPATPTQYTEDLVAQLACPRRAGTHCVLGATEGRDQVFYELDPRAGRSRKIMSLSGPPPWVWAISTDGAQLLVAHREHAVQVIDVRAGQARVAVSDPAMLAFAATWIDGDRGFLLSGDADHVERIIRFEGSQRTVLWSTATQTVSTLGTSANGREVRVKTLAWNRGFGLLESR